MASIDPRIAMGIQPVQLQNPLEQYAQFAQVQGIQQRNKLADLAMQDRQMELDQQNALARLYKDAVGADGSIDRNRIMTGAAESGLGAVIPKLQKGFADQDKSASDARKSKLESDMKQLEIVGQIAGSVKDPASFAAANRQLAAIGVPSLGDAFDAGQVRQIANMALARKDQLKNEWDELEFKLKNANEAFSIGADGKPVANVPYQQYQVQKARAGKTDVNLAVNTEKGFLGELAKGVGSSVEASMGQAKAAAGTINNLNQIRTALDSGKIITGPGADTKILLKQIGVSLGVGGKDDAEILANTRSAMQAMAGQELSAAEAMKGQGAVTENERGLIRRAAAGDITMTAPEIMKLTQAIEKVARGRIRSHAENVRRLGANPAAAPIVDFMRVDEPPAYEPPKAAAKPTAAVAIPDAAKALLRQNPALRAQFEAKYGAGTAASVLGGQ